MAEPIALQIQTPNAMTTIGNMVGIANAIQANKLGGVELEKKRKTLDADISQRISESARSGTEASLAAQTLAPKVAEAEATSRTAQEAAKQAEIGTTHKQFQLTGEQAQKARDYVTALAQDPAVISGDAEGIRARLYAMHDQMIANGVPKDVASFQLGSALGIAGANPQGFRQHIANLTQAGTGAGGQAALNQVSAGSQQTPGINPVTNSPVVTGKDQFGNVTGVTTAPQPQQAPPGVQPVPNLQPGDSQEMPALVQHRTDARTALVAAPDLHQNNRAILDEIDKVTTGTTGPVLQKIFSTLGVATDTAEKRASAYDLLGKYLERNALQTAQTMGPHTNSGLETVKAAQGSTAYNPTAIKKITKLVDANVTGTEAYQPGLEKAIANAGGRGVFAVREYQQQWGQNYDPRIPMLANAKKSGDRAEYDSIIKSMGGENSPTYRELMDKARNLDRLSTQGRL